MDCCGAAVRRIRVLAEKIGTKEAGARASINARLILLCGPVCGAAPRGSGSEIVLAGADFRKDVNRRGACHAKLRRNGRITCPQIGVGVKLKAQR